MLKKRAQGLSINVIIVAVIALIVLFVVIGIFNKQTGKTVSALDSCIARGGKCEDIGASECPDGGRRIPDATCEQGTSWKCCLST